MRGPPRTTSIQPVLDDSRSILPARITQKCDCAPLGLGARSVGEVPDDFAQPASPAVAGEFRRASTRYGRVIVSWTSPLMSISRASVGGQNRKGRPWRLRVCSRDPAGLHESDPWTDHDAGLHGACSGADQSRSRAPIEALPRPTAQLRWPQTGRVDGVGVDQKGGPRHRAPVQGRARKGQDLGVDPDEHALGHPSTQRPIGEAPLSELARVARPWFSTHRTDARRRLPPGHPRRRSHPLGPSTTTPGWPLTGLGFGHMWLFRRGVGPSGDSGQHLDVTGCAMMGACPAPMSRPSAARDLLVGVARVTPVAPAAILPGRVGVRSGSSARTSNGRVVQGPRGLHPSGQTDRARSRRRGGRRQCRQPRPGVARGGAAAGHQVDRLHARGAPAEGVRDARLRGRRGARGHTIEEAWGMPRDSPPRRAVLIHPFDHDDIVAGQATVGLEILEQVPDVANRGGLRWWRGVVAGIATAMVRWRPDVQVDRGPGRQAAAYPASLAAGDPVRLDQDAHDGRRHRRGTPGKVPFGMIVRARRRDLHRLRGSLSRALLLSLERVQTAGRARWCGRCRGASWTSPASSRRSWRCCRAGTSTRCCCCRSFATGWPRPAATWPFTCGIADHPGALAGCCAKSPRP